MARTAAILAAALAGGCRFESVDTIGPVPETTMIVIERSGTHVGDASNNRDRVTVVVEPAKEP